MNLTRGLLLLATFAGCGEAVARPKSGAQDEAVLPKITRPEGAPPTTTAGLPTDPLARNAGIQGPQALKRVFEAFLSLERSEATDDVRIAHFGDSHTAADLETAAIRRVLAARFGDGGRGFVSVGTPYKGYLQEGVHPSSFHKFESIKPKRERGRSTGDGRYGLLGVAVGSGRKDASASTDISARSSRMELSYLEQPKGGTFDFLVDDTRIASIKTTATEPRTGFRLVSVPEGPHQIEVRARGDGDVRFFGVALDRAQLGITYDALGINGARASGMLGWDEAHFAENLSHRDPRLVVIAFGTNEALDDTSLETYERQLVDLMGRMARAVPRSACLIMGPPDMAQESDGAWAPVGRLYEIVNVQARVAAAAGCAFYSQVDAMGGPGTILRWALEDPPRAQKDRVHFTRDSYLQMGQAFAMALLSSYDAWKADLAESSPTVR